MRALGLFGMIPLILRFVYKQSFDVLKMILKVRWRNFCDIHNNPNSLLVKYILIMAFHLFDSSVFFHGYSIISRLFLIVLYNRLRVH